MLKKILSLLKDNLKYVVLIYIIVQLVLIFFFPAGYRSDPAYYYKLAQECLNANSFYPAPQHLYEDYIFAPLFIDVLVIALYIVNSTITIGLLNLLLNLLQLLLVYKITKNLFGKSEATFTALLYIFYLNNVGLVLANYTELLFGVLTLSSIYFYFRKTKTAELLSGIFLGAAIAVRPVGLALLASYLLLFVYLKIKKKTTFPIFRLSAGLIIFILVFGGFNYLHFGKFIFVSTTGTVNLLIGANDDATGGFNADVFLPGKVGYIEKPDTLTYTYKNDFYMQKAINWIKTHPIKWISLMPMKFIHTFIWDDISLSYLLHSGDWDLPKAIKYLIKDKSIRNIMPRASNSKRALFFITELVHQIYYLILSLLIILGIRLWLKHGSIIHLSSVILLFALIILIIILIIFGNPRYKYPILILTSPFAGYYINYIFFKSKKGQVVEKY